MGDLKSLQTITGLSLSPANIQNLVDEFRTFGVVAFGPIIAWVDKDQKFDSPISNMMIVGFHPKKTLISVHHSYS